MTEFYLLIAVLLAIYWFVRHTPMPQLEACAVAAVTDGEPPAKPQEERPEWEKYLQFKKDGAPDPDPQIGEAAKMEAQLGQDWLAFAQEQFNQASDRQEGIDELSSQVTQQQLATSEQAQQWAQQDRERYENQIVPLEDRYIQDAQDWDSEANQNRAAAQARTGIMQESGVQRGITERRLAGMGVDPRSGRYAATKAAEDTRTGVAAVGAGNAARTQRQAVGRAMRSDAINMGKGLPSQAASAAALGLSAGSTAQGTALNAAGNAVNNTGIMSQGYQGAMQGYGNQANILNQQFQNEMQGYMADQQAAAGMWSGLGSMAGTAAGLYMMSSKEFKEGKEPIEGSAVEAALAMPVERWTYKQGIGDGGRHIGPYAEDFQEATGQGDGESIPLQDMMGLQLAAIQELGTRIEKLEAGAGNNGRVIEGSAQRIAA